MQKICDMLVPKILTDKQKEKWESILLEMLECITSDSNFFNSVISNDKTCVFQYDPVTKRQSAEWHVAQSPCEKKARTGKSKRKSMLIDFFNTKGIVHKEFPATRTNN